jgi:hypothetical protein
MRFRFDLLDHGEHGQELADVIGQLWVALDFSGD